MISHPITLVVEQNSEGAITAMFNFFSYITILSLLCLLIINAGIGFGCWSDDSSVHWGEKPKPLHRNYVKINSLLYLGYSVARS